MLQGWAVLLDDDGRWCQRRPSQWTGEHSGLSAASRPRTGLGACERHVVSGTVELHYRSLVGVAGEIGVSAPTSLASYQACWRSISASGYSPRYARGVRLNSRGRAYLEGVVAVCGSAAACGQDGLCQRHGHVTGRQPWNGSSLRSWSSLGLPRRLPPPVDRPNQMRTGNPAAARCSRESSSRQEGRNHTSWSALDSGSGPFSE